MMLNLIANIFCPCTRDATGKGSGKSRAKACNEVKNESQDRKKTNRRAVPFSDHLRQPARPLLYLHSFLHSDVSSRLGAEGLNFY